MQFFAFVPRNSEHKHITRSILSKNQSLAIPLGSRLLHKTAFLFLLRHAPKRCVQGPGSGLAYCVTRIIIEVKLDVYGKRQTAKIKLLPSVFSSLYSGIKIFVFAVNSKRQFSIFA